MRYLKRSLVAFSLLLASASNMLACELPAHPNAAAMPVGITLRGSSNEITIDEAMKKGAVKLIQGTNDASFYYLIPEGSKVKLRIVWDPVCHNNPSPVGSDDFKYKTEQYDYVYSAELKIKEDKEIGKIGGYYFFPLQAMSEYFTLSGNRKDASEAFSREYGNLEGVINDVAGVGPALIFNKSFAAKGATDLGFSIVGGTQKDYSDDPTISATKVNDMDGIDAIDTYLPGPHWNMKDVKNDIFLLEPAENGKKKVARLVNRGAANTKPTWGYCATGDANNIVHYLPGKSGIDMKDIDFGLKNPEPKNYRAYIVENENKKQIHAEGIGYDPKADDAARGNDSDCSFYVNFTTPSIGGDELTKTEGNAIVKIMVNSPPAGYNLTNLYWIWEEQVYKRVTSGKYTLANDSEKPSIMPTDDDSSDDDKDKDKDKDDKESDSDDDEDEKKDDEKDDEKDDDKDDDTDNSSIVLDAKDEKYFIYEKAGAVRKCSVGLGIVVCKISDGIGYAAYKIYDDCGPVTSSLQVYGAEGEQEAPKYFEEDKSDNITSKFTFDIDLVDSNPYFAKDIALSGKDNAEQLKKDKDISQSNDKMDLTFFYNYPVYDYKMVEKKSVEDLKGVGLIDLPSTNKDGSQSLFNGYVHDTKWFWHKAESVKIDSVTLTKEIRADSAADPEQRLIGSINRISGSFEIQNPKPWHETEGSGNNFTVFAVFKDKAGNTHVTDIFKYEPKKTESAKPENIADKSYAMDPTKENVEELAANNDTNGPDAPYFAQDLEKQVNWDGKNWQAVSHLKSDDKTAPEIQVVVLDTRTNRYHIFGTSENVAGGLNNMNNRTDDKTYAGIPASKIPYINKNTAISESYLYKNFNDIDNLFALYLQGKKEGSGSVNAVSTVMDTANKNGFVCQKNSRIIFYPRAFDNIDYMDTTKNCGVQSFEVTFEDENSPKRVKLDNPVTSMGTPIEYVFRQENVDRDNKVTPYTLKVRATDYSNNTREFFLDIAVTGRTLDIRTLEEKRERIK